GIRDFHVTGVQTCALPIYREVGTLPLLAPIGAAGLLVLVVVFSDQTLAAVLEATRVRTIIGPNEEWWNDFLRYYYLMVQTVDGRSEERRVGNRSRSGSSST